MTRRAYDPSRFSRRAFLAATGLSPAFVPLLPGTARAQGATKKRFVVIAVPNGHTGKFIPQGGETGWTISRDADSPLQPLMRHRERLLILGGIVLQNGYETTKVVTNAAPERGFQPGTLGGHAAPCILLSGAVGVEGPRQFDDWNMTAGGPSVDFHIAQNQPDSAGIRYRPLAMRATRRTSPSAFISFRGAPVTPRVQNATAVHDDPVALWRDMFGGGALGAEEQARILARRRHVLDFAHGQLRELRDRFGAANRARVEGHLHAIEGVTRQAQSLAAGACQTPPQPSGSVNYLEPSGNQAYPTILKTQIDLAVVAMACDLTRSVSMLWSDGANDSVNFRWLRDKDPGFDSNAPSGQLGGGQIRSHHNIAHHDNGALKNYSDQWFIEQYAYLLDQLAATPDADGRPLLETTVVLYANMQRTGGGHEVNDIFWILAGNHDRAYRTGRFLRWPSGTQGRTIPQNRILTSLINSSGCPPIEFFGDRRFGGELPVLHG